MVKVIGWQKSLHITWTHPKCFVGTKLTATVLGQTWSQEERCSPTPHTAKITSTPLYHDPERDSSGEDSWRRAALVAAGKSHQHPTGPMAVIKHFSVKWRAIYPGKLFFHCCMPTPWHKGRDQNNAVRLSPSSTTSMSPTSADSLTCLWAHTHPTRAECEGCFST